MKLNLGTKSNIPESLTGPYDPSLILNGFKLLIGFDYRARKILKIIYK